MVSISGVKTRYGSLVVDGYRYPRVIRLNVVDSKPGHRSTDIRTGGYGLSFRCGLCCGGNEAKQEQHDQNKAEDCLAGHGKSFLLRFGLVRLLA